MSSRAERWRAAAVPDRARFEAVRSGALAGWLARDLDAHVRARCLRDPDALLAEGIVLKDDAASTVVALAGGGLVLKRFRYPDALRALRRALRPSRATQAFRAALRLEAFGIGVAAPLAVLEQRRFGVASASWLLSAGLPGRDAGAWLADPALDEASRERLVDGLTSLVERLQRERIVHGDLKATNFLVDEADVRLLDLHAVRRSGPAIDRGLRRDRRRFLRNLEPWPALQARAQVRLEGRPSAP